MSASKARHVYEAKTCYLESITDPRSKIYLFNKVPLMLGKTLLTNIDNPRLSKTQVQIEVDYSTGRAVVEQFGKNKSAVNGQPMTRREKRTLYHGDTLTLLFYSGYTYQYNFI